MRKKILVLTQTLPALGGHGTAMRLGNIVEVLAQQHDVTLICVSVDRPMQKEVLGEYWRKQCARSVYFNVADEAEPLRLKQKRALTRLLDKRPKLLATWPMQAILMRLQDLKDTHFDAVLVSRLRLMPVWRAFLKHLNIRADWRVLDLDDIESRSQALQVRMHGVSHLGKLGYLLEWLESAKLAREEERAFKEMDRVLLCSQEDKAILARRFEARTIGIVPNTIRIPELLPSRSPVDGFRLLFVGTLNYAPNQQAVMWLVQSIMPKIREKVGANKVSLTVVGRAPTEWIREQAATGAFSLHGDVPDVKPFYASCDAVLVPIRAGSGTRIKILEAFGYGRVVISTTVGVEGLDAEHQKELLIVDSAGAFADSVAQLMENPVLQQLLISNARKKVEQRYSPESCEQAVEQNLRLRTD